MEKLTVFIISCGEEVFEECRRAIASQKLPSDLEVDLQIIQDVTPMSEAFNEMHRRSETAYFVQVDADMILKEDALATLYRGVKRSFPWTYVAYGQLYEEGFGVGGTVRCWKKSFFRFFQFRNRRTVDRDLFKRARRFGFRRKNLKKVLGIHRPRHSVFSEYLKTKADVEKWRFLGRDADLYAVPLLKELIEKPSENRYRIVGAVLGALTSIERVRQSKDFKHESAFLENVLESAGMTDLKSLEDRSIDDTTLNSDFIEVFRKSYSGEKSGADLVHRLNAYLGTSISI